MALQSSGHIFSLHSLCDFVSTIFGSPPLLSPFFVLSCTHQRWFRSPHSPPLSADLHSPSFTQNKKINFGVLHGSKSLCAFHNAKPFFCLRLHYQSMWHALMNSGTCTLFFLLLFGECFFSEEFVSRGCLFHEWHGSAVFFGTIPNTLKLFLF